MISRRTLLLSPLAAYVPAVPDSTNEYAEFYQTMLAIREELLRNMNPDNWPAPSLPFSSHRQTALYMALSATQYRFDPNTRTYIRKQS